MLETTRTRLRRTAALLVPLALLASPATVAGQQGGPPVEEGAPPPPAPGTPPPEECLHRIRGARIAHLEGDHDRERELLAATVEEFPHELAALRAMLSHLEEHGGEPEREGELRRRLAARLVAPEGDWPLWTLRRLARTSTGDPAVLEAIAHHLEERLEGPGGDDPELLDLLASVAEAVGEDGLAARALERRVELAPRELDRWRLLHLYRALERREDAAALLRDWLEESPLPHLRGLYIEELAALGRIDELERQVGLYLGGGGAPALGGPVPAADEPSVPVVGGVLERAAWLLRDAGRDAAAEELFRRLVALDPEHEGARQALLYLYGSAEELRAVGAARAERWQGEEDARSLFDEGTSRLAAGDAEGALDLLRRASAGLPDFEPAWYNLGMAALRLEEWETVAAAFGRAVELEPSRPESHHSLGLALARLERCAEAVEALERGLELDPGRTAAHYWLASCYGELGAAEEALRHWELYQASKE